MIGDTIATADQGATTGNLPDNSAGVTTYRKRNQDNFGAEYAFKGTSYDYLIRVRNSYESPNVALGYRLTRHNCEWSLTKRPAAGVRAIPLIVSLTCRYDPDLGDPVLVKALAGHACMTWSTRTIVGSVGGFLQSQLNFES
jgi:hypothetical protein